MHIDIHDHAKQDLRAIKAIDPSAVAAVLVALEQIQADPRAIDLMTTYGNNVVGTVRLSLKPWESAKGIGNLWRFRMLDSPATVYRVVYGYHWQTRQICVLAVVHKDTFDYDNLSSDLAKRIFADWRAL
ncbi:MAG: hypothetical protein HGA75_00905 [Thiobacillus sp.]|nr:hypothetical protein [Thiobacillus sp.]